MDEVAAALSGFLKGLGKDPNTRVVIVGLAGSGPFPGDEAPALTSMRAPIAVSGGASAQSPSDATDLTDVHATLRALGGASAEDAKGYRYDALETSPWSNLAFASVGDQWDIALSEGLALVTNRVTGGQTWLKEKVSASGASEWLPRTETSPITDLLFERRRKARQCAGERWSRAINLAAPSSRSRTRCPW